MTALVLVLTLAILTALSPSKVLFVGLSLLLSFVYLFAANIPMGLLGIAEFVRYAKEPLIASLLARVVTRELLRSRGRAEVFTSARLTGQGVVLPPSARWWFLGLVVWASMTLFQTGAAGVVGYVRGIVFPAALLLYLNGIEDRRLERLRDAVAWLATGFTGLLALLAVIHLYVDPEFLIPSAFRNRLDYAEPYRSVIDYNLQIRRYQSFFGDPNRTAIVCLLALWLSSIGVTRRFRWITLSVVAALVWVTESRSGMLITTLWALYLLLRPNSSRLIPLVGFVAASLAAIGGLAWLLYSTRAGSVEEISRAVIWVGVVQHVLGSIQVLLLGEGFGWVGQVGAAVTVSDAVQLTTRSGRVISLSVIDNSYLTLISSVGLVGAVILIGFYKSVLTSMSSHTRALAQRRQFWILVGLMGVWSLFFDSAVSFPWTFLFPVVLRFAIISPDVSPSRTIVARPAVHTEVQSNLGFR